MRLSGLILLLVLCAGLAACPSQDGGDDALVSARKAYSIGHFSEAERIYQHYLQARPEGDQRWEAWNRLVEISINVLGDYEKAAGLLNSMYLEFGDDPARAWDMLTRLATVYEQMQRFPDAVKVWRKALALPGLATEQRGQVYLRMAALLRQQREYAQAGQVLQACVQESPPPEVTGACLYQHAQVLENMLRRAQAQTLNNEYADLDVTDLQQRIKGLLNRIRTLDGVSQERKAMATFLLADLLESQGQKEEARELFASIRETYPNPMVIEARLKGLQ